MDAPQDSLVRGVPIPSAAVVEHVAPTSRLVIRTGKEPSAPGNLVLPPLPSEPSVAQAPPPADAGGAPSALNVLLPPDDAQLRVVVNGPYAPDGEAKPHSIVKLNIWRAYLQRAVLARSGVCDVFVITDLFSGPGSYTNAWGSPMVALDALLSLPAIRELAERKRFSLIVSYKPGPKSSKPPRRSDETRNEHQTRLQQEAVQGLYNAHDIVVRQYAHLFSPTMRQNIDFQARYESFANMLPGVVQMVTNLRSSANVSVVSLIDPCGYSDIPLSLVAQLCQGPHDDAFINFNVEGLCRGLKTEHGPRMFGEQRWNYMKADDPDKFKSSSKPNPAETWVKFDWFATQYGEALADADLTIRGCAPKFRMIRSDNHTVFFMVFASKCLPLIDTMKTIMCACSGFASDGVLTRYVYHDRYAFHQTEHRQPYGNTQIVAFGAALQPAEVEFMRAVLMQQFGGQQRVTDQELELFIARQSFPYDRHALAAFEHAGVFRRNHDNTMQWAAAPAAAGADAGRAANN